MEGKGSYEAKQKSASMKGNNEKQKRKELKQ